jgi:transcriptional regulator with XRE-family HTH domain
MLKDNIKKIREDLSISQRELARRINMSSQMISKIERGETSPSIETLDKIAIALGVTITDLWSLPDFNKKFTYFYTTKVSKGEAREALIKFINYIATLEDYVMGSEYNEIIDSSEDLIRGKILIFKSKKGKEKANESKEDNKAEIN